MDIRCRHCGEPIDTHEFHVENPEQNGTWEQWTALFREYGCSVLDAMWSGEPGAHKGKFSKCGSDPILTEQGMEVVEVATELCGDDVDGIASMIDDMLFVHGD